MAVIVVKIATPPPRGTAVRANLSAAGYATNPTRSASFLTTVVKMSDSANEPTSKITANVIRLVAPCEDKENLR